MSHSPLSSRHRMRAFGGPVERLRAPEVMLLIGGFCALIAFKPSEPFLVSYLLCEKHISSHDITHAVFPVWTYTYLALLPCMSLFAELAGYRLVVLVGVVGRILTLVIILTPFSTGSILLMQISQASVAVGFAAHPSLSAIMFRTLPTSAYARGAGIVASAGVLSEVVASLLGQLMLALDCGLAALFVVSCGSTATALSLACLLPSPQTRLSMKNDTERHSSDLSRRSSCDLSTTPASQQARQAAGGCSVLEDADAAGRMQISEVLPLPASWSMKGLTQAMVVLADMKRVMRESSALRFYVWLAVGTAVHHLVLTYWQALKESWTESAVQTPSPVCRRTSAFNGYIQAVASLLGGVVVLMPMIADRFVTATVGASLRFWLVVITPLVMAILLMQMSVTRTDIVFSSCYVMFHVTFEVMRVVCVAEGARCVASVRWHGPPRFALMGGLSLTVALLLQSLLQLVFDQLSRTSLPLSGQFRIFAGLFFLLHVAYVVDVICRTAKSTCFSHSSCSANSSAAVESDSIGEGDSRPYREISGP